MKKFISMVMAAAMVVSLVPATAFAASDKVEASAKVVHDLELTKTEIENAQKKIEEGTFIKEVPELQLTITRADYQNTNPEDAEMEVTLTLDNADFIGKTENQLKSLVSFVLSGDRTNGDIRTYWKQVANNETHYVTSKNTAPGVDKEVTDITGLYTKDEVTTGTALSGDAAIKYLYDHDATFALVTGATDVKVTKAGATEEVAYDGTTDNAWKNGWTLDKVIAAVIAGEVTITTGADQIKVSCEGVIVDATLDTVSVTSANQIDIFEAANKVTLIPVVAAKANVSSADGDELKVKEVKDIDDNEATFVIEGAFVKGDKVVFDLESIMDKVSEGRTATVSVESDMVTADDLVYVSILGQGISASIKGTASVAEEEKITLSKDLKIKSNVGKFANGQEFTIKTSKGFEFTKNTSANAKAEYTLDRVDDNEYTLTWNGAPTDEITVDADDIEIEATSAKSGATCTLTIKAVKDSRNPNTFTASTTVEVMKVVDYKVELTVDEDEDVPVIYSGVNVDNYGITDDSDHWSLEVTAEETFPGAWSMRKGFSFELPEGVYVADVDVTDTENFVTTKGNNKAEADAQEWQDAFWNAYQEGDHVNFEFEKRVFDDVNTDLEEDPATVTFQLQLVADPTFEGDVVLKLVGDLVDEQEVTIAKFVKPYTVKAEQNDLKIDYRYTEIPTAITITEAEAGLWAKEEATFRFEVEKNDYIVFEDDPTFEIDKDSELEIKNDEVNKDGQITFTVKSESDEAATVTLKDMSLFMQRSIPAGPYDLSIGSTLADEYENQMLFAPDDATNAANVVVSALAADAGKDAPDMDDVRLAAENDRDGDNYVGDVCDYSDVVKAAFVNVITSGRDKDDASFTTKVVVPVGESYIIAGETQVALDVPAYVSAAGYTMLPVRAVAVALGIDTQNVLWNQPTRTVTILYGQRIITMTAGQKVVYVNGSAIPASASVEIVNGRTFLPMRDLATALGVTDITWDAATKTATLNGSK